MNKIAIEQWIALLRSGEYKQTYGVLGIPGTNCRCDLGGRYPVKNGIGMRYV
jgi:hypothetical protein